MLMSINQAPMQTSVKCFLDGTYKVGRGPELYTPRWGRGPGVYSQGYIPQGEEGRGVSHKVGTHGRSQVQEGGQGCIAQGGRGARGVYPKGPGVHTPRCIPQGVRVYTPRWGRGPWVYTPRCGGEPGVCTPRWGPRGRSQAQEGGGEYQVAGWVRQVKQGVGVRLLEGGEVQSVCLIKQMGRLLPP